MIDPHERAELIAAQREGDPYYAAQSVRALARRLQGVVELLPAAEGGARSLVVSAVANLVSLAYRLEEEGGCTDRSMIPPVPTSYPLVLVDEGVEPEEAARLLSEAEARDLVVYLGGSGGPSPGTALLVGEILQAAAESDLDISRLRVLLRPSAAGGEKS